MNRTADKLESQASLDYARIERAILYLQHKFLDQPDLATVARAMHMSEYHFQRLFSRWAGLSPKRFLQFLTLKHSKQQLLESKPLLDAALDSGLSSPGRLHDLFVSIEAMTPGEFKSRGAALHIRGQGGPCPSMLALRGGFGYWRFPNQLTTSPATSSALRLRSGPTWLMPA